MRSLFSDLQYSARELRKRPGFVLTAVLSLALGIGATSAVFSVIYAVLIDPFPYPNADRMVEFRLLDKSGNIRYTGFNGPQIQQLRQAKSVESVTGMDGWNLTTTDGDIPEDVVTSYLNPERPQSLGSRRALWPLARTLRRPLRPGPSARRRPLLRILAALLPRRSQRHRPHHPTRPQTL